MAGPDIPFGGGGAHVMRFNAKVTIGSFEGRKLIYISQNLGGPGPITPPPPRSASAIVCTILLCLSGIYFRLFRIFVNYILNIIIIIIIIIVIIIAHVLLLLLLLLL